MKIPKKRMRMTTRKKRSPLKGSDDEDEDEDAKPAKKRKLPDLVKKGAAAKKNSAGDGIDEVIEEVLSSEPAKSTAKDKLGEIPQKWKEKLAKMTVPQLKILLESNQQVKTGNKGELLNRIVDACINGAFPKCDVCHGGKVGSNLISMVSC
ncbi:hypothetical protein BJ742DRAFT_55822 [Cladochytrium replicatum]|nr:hypothetical protein BJ742DRAFT_55822 [Cladochytrium replicatum]